MQYSEKSCNGLLLKFSMKPVEQLTVTPCYCLEVHFFWIIQLQLVGLHAEYHTGIQHSEKRPNPSDENCIFSTLLYICDQVSKLRVEVPTVAFDQPLWKIVYRLG